MEMNFAMMYGMAFGWIFIQTLVSLVVRISDQRAARKAHKGYVEWLAENDKRKEFVWICRTFKLSWLMNLRLVYVIDCLLRILVMLVCLATLVGLFVLKYFGYGNWIEAIGQVK